MFGRRTDVFARKDDRNHGRRRLCRPPRNASRSMPCRRRSPTTSCKQYFQQPNQVMERPAIRIISTRRQPRPHGHRFRTLGYPAVSRTCTRDGPKFTQNLWYAAPGGGVAAMLYSPSEVSLKVGGGHAVTIGEDTPIPWRTKSASRSGCPVKKPANSPFHLRIPAWCRNAEVRLNRTVIGESPAAGA